MDRTELIPLLVQSYADQYTSPEDAVLAQVHADTTQQHSMAHMLSGQVQGKFLEMISRLIQPQHILEIGTFTGYSGICLARGLAEGGKLHTIELREDDAATAQQNFNKASVQDKIILHVGNALNIIPTLTPTWDLVFLDADKTGYLDYYKMVLPRMRKGAVLIADNVLFHGEVLQQPLKGKNAIAIHAFNEYVRQDDSVDKVLLTIRDGLLFIIKK